MYILFILFFASLAGITFMVGRKLVFLRNGKAVHNAENAHQLIPDIQKIKHVVVKNTKKGTYAATVVILRFYVQSKNSSRENYAKIKKSIENKLNSLRKQGVKPQENKESKFLKMISDYKHKIRHIKKEIEEETK